MDYQNRLHQRSLKKIKKSEMTQTHSPHAVCPYKAALTTLLLAHRLLRINTWKHWKSAATHPSYSLSFTPFTLQSFIHLTPTSTPWGRSHKDQNAVMCIKLLFKACYYSLCIFHLSGLNMSKVCIVSITWNVFTITFDQFSASLLNKSRLLFFLNNNLTDPKLLNSTREHANN